MKNLAPVKKSEGEMRGARLSRDETYRYALWRVWNPSLPVLLVVGLNPSTADASSDDATIRVCRNLAKRWGMGGLVMANLFAYRTKTPAIMRSAQEPVGPRNDRWLRYLARRAGLVLAAWGTNGSHLGRAHQVCQRLPLLHCLALNRDGSPHHPLKVKIPDAPLPFRP